MNTMIILQTLVSVELLLLSMYQSQNVLHETVGHLGKYTRWGVIQI